MIEKLKQELNDRGYNVKKNDSWIHIKQDKEEGDVHIIFCKREKWIKVDVAVDLEVLEIAIKLFKELDND